VSAARSVLKERRAFPAPQGLLVRLGQRGNLAILGLKALPEPPYVMLAGAVAPENEQAWKDAGIDEYVNVRANNYLLNRKMLVLLGAIAK